jgi:hypothetical protein
LVVLLVGVPASVPAATVTNPPATAAALYNLRGYPHASFVWFPASPHPGERISLVSTSTDATSPIVAYAWDVADDGPFGAFHPGGPATSTSFPTPASHVVRLRVTAADGLSGVASETIHMSAPPPGVLLPFPNVRIVGRVLRSGVRLTVLAVRAPQQALIRVSCGGTGCPVRSLTRVSVSRAGRTAWTAVRRFERFLPAGVTLEIRVTRGTDIGAYTRFVVRRRRLPLRVDACLDPATRKPIACPA